MNKVNAKIRIAIQNKGRLMEPSLEYLKKCGLKFKCSDRQLVVPCENFDIEILFVRNSDVPECVRYNVADYGIVGRNVLEERKDKFEILRTLDFGKCQLVIAVPKNSTIKKIQDLEHERIATSYPRILKAYLNKMKVSASIIEINGSVEICPALGLSDAIFDITQTGTTLRENGLVVMQKVADSEALLIKNPNSNPQYEDLFI